MTAITLVPTPITLTGAAAVTPVMDGLSRGLTVARGPGGVTVTRGPGGITVARGPGGLGVTSGGPGGGLGVTVGGPGGGLRGPGGGRPVPALAASGHRLSLPGRRQAGGGGVYQFLKGKIFCNIWAHKLLRKIFLDMFCKEMSWENLLKTYFDK